MLTKWKCTKMYTFIHVQTELKDLPDVLLILINRWERSISIQTITYSIVVLILFTTILYNLMGSYNHCKRINFSWLFETSVGSYNNQSALIKWVLITTVKVETIWDLMTTVKVETI